MSEPKKPPSTAAAPSRKLAASRSPANRPPSRSPSRLATESSAAPGTLNAAPGTLSGPPGTLNRTRSIRSAANSPMSARAAARKPADGAGADADTARAELQAKLDELQEKLREAERACEDSHKQAAVLQLRLDEALKEQGLLEERAHERSERVEELEGERRESLRARRELEHTCEAERAQALRDAEAAQARDDEMQAALQRLRDSLAQRDLRDRAIDPDNGRSVSPDAETGQFAPPSSIQQSDSPTGSRTIMQEDKVIEGLRLELAEAQIKLVELENQGGGGAYELQKELYDIKMQNARLTEENESFQLLLSEKTLNGDFASSDLLRVPSGNDSRPSSRPPLERGSSLADELGEQQDEADVVEGARDRRLQAEVGSLKDQNKALTLYINNIISRLLQHEQFEQILDKTPDLMAGPGALSRKVLSGAIRVDSDDGVPPPPPPKDDYLQPPAPLQEGMASGLLQRARSVMGGRPKPRQMSNISNISSAGQSDTSEPRMNENPDTAPRIPIGRSNSTRGHRRTNSDWPAASLVTNMMSRGGQMAVSPPGPTSPGLTSPTLGGRNSFFGPGAIGTRVTSGGSGATNTAVPTISEQQDKENVAPARSGPSDLPPAAIGDFETLDDAPLATVSPPRSSSSSGGGERERGEARAPAIMMGSKPRPLRLVQEAADDDKARRAANRSSWFGWMNTGGAVGGNFNARPGGTPPAPQ